MRPVSLESPPRPKIKQGGSRSEAEGTTKQSQRQYLMIDRILNHVWVIVLLCHIQGRLLHGLGRILVITYL